MSTNLKLMSKWNDSVTFDFQYLRLPHRYRHIAVLWMCANWLAMSNSCHNPFIYGLCSVSDI